MTSELKRIAIRAIEQREAYLPGTGLTVWEITWVARQYGDDIESTARQLSVELDAVREALAYAADHRFEIEAQIHDHVGWTLEELQRADPRATFSTVDICESDGSDYS